MRDRRGAIGLLVALIFPVLIAFGLLSVDVAHLYYRNILLRQTVQAAALAGGNLISTYYTSGNNSSSAIVAAAQTFATANMPTATYGSVVAASDVVLGNWYPATATFTSLAQNNGNTPNAVKVTGRNGTGGGNAVGLFFGGLFGLAPVNLTSTAITSYATSQAFHTILVNDLSQSFSSDIPNQRAADKAMLDCVKSSSSPLSNFAIIGFTGHYGVLQSLTQAGANYNTIVATINGMKSCGNTGMPACSGSNVASGIYRATKSDMFGSASYAGTLRNIVIITDGVPNASKITYGREDGIYPTPTSTTPTCTSRCTDSNLLTMAQNQAAYARSLGVSISTIYYSGNTSSSQRASYAASLASLTGGTGISLVVPTSSQISSSFAAFCATMSSKLMAVM